MKNQNNTNNGISNASLPLPSGHDGLILEFRASKPWNLTTPSVDNLKAVTATLWEAMDNGGRFMDNAALPRDIIDFGR